MERTGVTPPGAVPASDLAPLAELLLAPGPWATVYLATESAVENAAQRSEQHWKDARRALLDAGAPEEVVDLVDPVVADAHLFGECLGAVAGAGGRLHVEHGPQAPPRDQAMWSALPSVLPMVAWRQALPIHVAVLADRTGADIVVAGHHRRPRHEEAGSGGYPLSKSSPGGWSQPRYQRRAENTWERTADDVAAEITDLVDRYDARLVVMAGDVRARALIRQALPEHVAARLEEVSGGRADDGSGDELAEEVRGRLAGAVATDTVHLLDKFTEERGQGDRAADGPEATLGALARAQVDVLLVHDDPDDRRQAVFGPEPTHVALAPAELASLGVDRPTDARLVDVAVRAALGTGASLRLVPGGEVPTGGLGAILRWPAAD